MPLPPLRELRRAPALGGRAPAPTRTALKPERRKRLLLGFLALDAVLLPLGYLLLWPVPIDPVPWTPPPAPPLSGPYAPNQALDAAEVFPLDGVGPEDVAVDAQGRIYGGLLDGRIVRLSPEGGSPEVVVDTGGRPLGLDFAPDGRLIVADAIQGLLTVDPETGALRSLAREHEGVPFRFTDDVDVGPDGVIYFTDASSRHPIEDYKLDLLEHRPWGRLLAYDPRTKTTRLLLGDLYFANGVAVSAGGEFLLVVETGLYRVLRYWLRGNRQGTHEAVIENLPGWPDGISAGSDGVFWLPLASPRDPVIDDHLFPSPWKTKVLLRLPKALLPAPARYGFVLGIRGDGSLAHNLQDPSPTSFSPVTSVEEFGGALYLGSLTFPGLARLPAPGRE